MNTLIFLGGMGSGALIACLLFITAMRVYANKASTSDEWHKQTLELMRERNQIAEQQLEIARRNSL